MDFHFDPTFSLLPKFTIGLRPMPTSEAEIKLVSIYLGVALPSAELQDNAKALSDELEHQNGEVPEEAIYHAGSFRYAVLIRKDVVDSHPKKTIDLDASGNPVLE